MRISRRRFLEKTVKGVTMMAGLSLPRLAEAIADGSRADGTTGDAAAPKRESGAIDASAGGANSVTAEDSAAGAKSGTARDSAADTRAGADSEPVSGASSGSAKLPAIKGQVVAAGDPDYDEARKNYNGRFNIKPKYILFCRNENDVVEAVKWARADKLKVSVRCGGHSYEAFSLVEDGVVIDVSRMANVKVDLARKIAIVDAGTTLIPLYDALWQKRVVVPGGSCATVGVAGLTMGGGFGLLARQMGLSCDNLQALRMVDANGKVLAADASHHSDLLWACRGGGAGNFGIATQFTFRVHPIGNVTIVRLRWNWQDMKAVIHAWQNWAPTTDSRFTSVLTLSSEAAQSLLFLGMFLGPPDKARALIEPVVSAAKPVKEAFEIQSFIDAAHRFSGFKRPHTQLHSTALPETVHVHAHPRFKNTSDYVNADLSDEAIDTIMKCLSESPIISSCVQFDGYGGAIARVPVKDSAFCHRAATKFCMHYQVSWARESSDKLAMDWVESFRRAMQPYVSGYSYANYCDTSIADWPHRYFGENYARLQVVKSRYDPEDFFSFAQGIRAVARKQVEQ